MMADLFADTLRDPLYLSDGVVILPSFILQDDKLIYLLIEKIAEQSPFRHMQMPQGYKMSVAMTSCGEQGWLSDERGYRYEKIDPHTKLAWPIMPKKLLELAINAASVAGYKNFIPNSCLINRYEPGSKLSLHQDKDEKDFSAPIVSFSLGIPAIFLLGGLKRSDKQRRIQLQHGDVIVMGGKARLFYHGILPIKENIHPEFGKFRYNLTFRKTD